jgi:hypothetical protein
MFKLYFLTSVADVVASVTLNYQLIRNSLEFEIFFFYLKIKTRVQILKNNIKKTGFIRVFSHSSHRKLPYGSFSTPGTHVPNQPL